MAAMLFLNEYKIFYRHVFTAIIISGEHIFKNSIRDARTPQPGEIFVNIMKYRSSETVHRLGYFQSNTCKD